MSRDTERPKLLVAEFHHLGDAVLAFPFIRSAQDKFEVHFSCRPAVREVAELVLPAEQIHTWNPPWHEDSPLNPGSASQIVAAWKSTGFSAVASVWPDPRLHALWWKAGIARRIGFPPTKQNHYGSHLRERAIKSSIGLAVLDGLKAFRVRMLTEELHRSCENPHQLEAWKLIARALDIPFRSESPWIAPSGKLLPPHSLLEVIDSGRRVLLAHTGGRLPTKLWPVEFWCRALKELRERLPEYQICSISGPGDPVLPALDGVISLPPPGTIKSLAAVLASADFVLSNDSMPAHLAHAVGSPVLAIFGSGDPSWFSPGGDMRNVIESPVCSWRPCLDVCRMPSRICLESVSPSALVQRVIQRLAEIGPERA